jgi:hypothetical protein
MQVLTRIQARLAVMDDNPMRFVAIASEKYALMLQRGC